MRCLALIVVQRIVRLLALPFMVYFELLVLGLCWSNTYCWPRLAWSFSEWPKRHYIHPDGIRPALRTNTDTESNL